MDINRARLPKKRTRSGCITCKKRRVKCDESKPICSRCKSFGVVCDGYVLGKTTETRSPPGRSVAINAQVQIPRARSEVQLPTGLFETEKEQQYFTLFSDKIAAEILPYFDPTPWRLMILQACASEVAIRHAATAIGALGKTFEAAQAGSGQRRSLAHLLAPTLGGPIETAQRVKSKLSRKAQLHEASLHHRYALEQYHKAIKHAQALVSDTNIRAVLITCIIMTCFEVLHGNQDSAAAQLQGGIGLLQDWKSKQKYASEHPVGFSSPAPNTIEDYLMQVLGRLEIQTMSFLDSRPVERHIALKEEGKTVIKDMPQPLASINQAQVYLDLIMRRMMHFTASTNHFKVSYAQYINASPKANQKPSALNGIQSLGQAEDRAEYLASEIKPWIDVKVASEYPPDPLSAFSAHWSEQDSLESEMATWFTAFTPLFKNSMQMDGRDSISALTLSLAAITSSISVRAAFIKSETEYDNFSAEFNKIVTQSTQLLEKLDKFTSKTKGTLAFSFDLGVIPPLYLTAVKCRISKVRRAALHLLIKYPRREGVWDSVTTAALGTWVTELEEESLTGDFVPEENRVRKGSIRFDLVDRRASMTCLQLDKEHGNFLERKKCISW